MHRDIEEMHLEPSGNVYWTSNRSSINTAECTRLHFPYAYIYEAFSLCFPELTMKINGDLFRKLFIWLGNYINVASLTESITC